MTIENIEKLPPLRTIIDKYGLNAKKTLGQNFLLDINLTSKIARVAGDIKNINIIEIGPGPGGLTRAILLNNAKQIYAIEKDARCVEALQELVTVAEGKLEIVEADATQINLADIIPAPRAIIANLPYNVSTVLLLGWLRDIDKFAHMTLMFQKEVALRICAKPKTKAYGRLSIMSQWLTDVNLAFDIPPTAFTPPPKVTSSVVHFTPKKLAPDAPSFKDMEKLLSVAFGQRRKMLRKSLKPILGNRTEEILIRADILPTNRAEDLTVNDYVRLCNLI